MALPKARLRIPDTAKAGEIIPVKMLIRHRMETGYRVDHVGKKIPRHIVKHLTVTYAGETVFAMDFTQGVAANPYISFFTRAVETGDLVFVWEDSDGTKETMQKRVTVK